MFCDKCKKEVPSDSEYCPFCGNVVEVPKKENESVSEIEKGYTYLELKQ